MSVAPVRPFPFPKASAKVLPFLDLTKCFPNFFLIIFLLHDYQWDKQAVLRRSCLPDSPWSRLWHLFTHSRTPYFFHEWWKTASKFAFVFLPPSISLPSPLLPPCFPLPCPLLEIPLGPPSVSLAWRSCPNNENIVLVYTGIPITSTCWFMRTLCSSQIGH